MKKFLLALCFALGATAAANACTAPPTACNLGAGIIVPNGNVVEYGGTAGPQTLASGSNPQWDWNNSGLSYAYIYAQPVQDQFGNNSWLGDSLDLTWQWQQNPLEGLPASGSSDVVSVHCFIVGNDGELWFDAVDWAIGAYTNGGPDSPIACGMARLDGNGLGPSNWFNASGQAANANTTVAQQYATLLGNAPQNIFGFGLVFGDMNCTPNWAGTLNNEPWPGTGNISCWANGAYAPNSHFTITSVHIE